MRVLAASGSAAGGRPRRRHDRGPGAGRGRGSDSRRTAGQVRRGWRDRTRPGPALRDLTGAVQLSRADRPVAVARLADLLRLTSDPPFAPRRVRVIGVVTAVPLSDAFLIADGTAGALVQLPEPASPPPPGTSVEVVGLLSVQGPRLLLERASVIPHGPGDAPPPRGRGRGVGQGRLGWPARPARRPPGGGPRAGRPDAPDGPVRAGGLQRHGPGGLAGRAVPAPRGRPADRGDDRSAPGVSAGGRLRPGRPVGRRRGGPASAAGRRVLDAPAPPWPRRPWPGCASWSPSGSAPSATKSAARPSRSAGSSNTRRRWRRATAICSRAPATPSG